MSFLCVPQECEVRCARYLWAEGPGRNRLGQSEVVIHDLVLVFNAVELLSSSLGLSLGTVTRRHAVQAPVAFNGESTTLVCNAIRIALSLDLARNALHDVSGPVLSQTRSCWRLNSSQSHPFVFAIVSFPWCVHVCASSEAQLL